MAATPVSRDRRPPALAANSEAIPDLTPNRKREPAQSLRGPAGQIDCQALEETAKTSRRIWAASDKPRRVLAVRENQGRGERASAVKIETDLEGLGQQNAARDEQERQHHHHHMYVRRGP